MFKRFAYTLATAVVAVVFVATSEQASAVVPYSQRCTPVGTILNTAGCHGYAFNDTQFWDPSTGINGGPVIYSAAQYAIPFSVNSPATLEAFMSGLLGMGNPIDYSYNYNKEGAAFIIATMLGHVGGGPGDFGSPTNLIAYAKQNFKAWSDVIDYYGSGANSNYSIDWGSPAKSSIIGSPTVNTTHACPAGTPSNVCQPTNGAAPSGAADSKNFAWYALAPGETEVTHKIVFHGPKTAANPSGIMYVIRRECGNPLGGPAWPQGDNCSGSSCGGGNCTGLQCGIPSGNFSLTPDITVDINGSSSGNGAIAQAGDTITFNYYIDNTSGSGDAPPIGCSAASETFTTYHPNPPTPETLSQAGTPATTCPQAFPTSPTNHHQVVPLNKDTFVAADGDSYCRTLTIDQATPSGPPKTLESCVYVAAKPYVKVFGGDAAAGTSFASSTGACTTDTDAEFLAWNSGAAGYAGAGVQYAAYALNAIKGFAANQNGAGAGAPSGLAFANSTAALPNVFGGSLGSWPCMPDYYDTLLPASGTKTLGATANVSSLTSGVYTAGDVELTGGNVNPNSTIQIFAKGNVYISGNITYTGKWNVKSMPLFEVIAQGNIYVRDDGSANGGGVTQMDGIYIAQPGSGGAGGTIYTCASGLGTPADVTNPDYYASCDDKLTVNGSLIANTVELLRTFGSVNASSAADSPTNNKAAESINDSPAFWIPTANTSTSNGSLVPGAYDYINSLPPIL